LKIKEHSSDESDSSSSSVSGEIRDFDQKRNFPFGESSNETNKKKRKIMMKDLFNLFYLS